jgi:hypothetical protein
MAEKQHAKRINGKLHFSTWAMCNTLGVTQQALSQWATQGCPKSNERGWWPLNDVLKWRGILPIKLSDEEKIEALETRIKELEAIINKQRDK